MVKIYVLGFAKWEFIKEHLDSLTEEELIQIRRDDVEHVTACWPTLDDFARANNKDYHETFENPSEYYIYFIYESLRWFN